MKSPPPKKKLSRRAYLLHKWRQRGIEIITKERVIYVAYGTPDHPNWVELSRDFRFGIQSVIN